MPLGLLAAGALAAAGGLGMAAARAIPGKLERNYRKQITADQKRLSGGAGGMSAGEREQARAEGVGAIQAQQAQERAQLARGAASGQAASGQRAEALASSQRAAHGARNQLDSSVRDQDLMVGAHQRQMLQQRQLAARHTRTAPCALIPPPPPPPPQPPPPPPPATPHHTLANPRTCAHARAHRERCTDTHVCMLV